MTDQFLWVRRISSDMSPRRMINRCSVPSLIGRETRYWILHLLLPVATLCRNGKAWPSTCAIHRTHPTVVVVVDVERVVEPEGH